MLIVRSPVRISFAGGGTDLPAYYEKFGGAVLSTSINKYFYTVLCSRNDGKLQIISSDLRVCETWQGLAALNVEDSELSVPLAAIKELSREVSADLFLSSEIPPGTGLGSSAAVCVNVLKTLTTYLRLQYSRYDLAETAYRIARKVLNKPVGRQDEFASAFGGLNLIQFERDGHVQVEPIQVDACIAQELQSNLMLFFTGAAHHSWTILQEQERSSSKSTGITVDALHQIRSLADRMKALLISGDLHGFGAALDEGWQAKKLLSDKISNSRIDALYALARQNGALGGKITGAGGGGFLLLYCEKPFQQQLRAAFSREGLKEMEFQFDRQGTHVVVNDPFIDGDERCGTEWTFVPSSAFLSRFVH